LSAEKSNGLLIDKQFTDKLHARRWKNERKTRAFAQFTFYFQLTAMTLHDVFGNGQA
jgi:hypothetical protein